MRSIWLSLPVLLLFTVYGCDDGGNGVDKYQEVTTVTFSYMAPTEMDPAIAADYPDCTGRVGQTHIHPEWRRFRAIHMQALDDGTWEITLNDVPVDQSMRIRISDPNQCINDPNGASVTNVYANDVLLDDIVDTPGNGIEPGLGFKVFADGTVEP